MKKDGTESVVAVGTITNNTGARLPCITISHKGKLITKPVSPESAKTLGAALFSLGERCEKKDRT